MKQRNVITIILLAILATFAAILTLPNGYVNKGEKKYPRVKMCPCDDTTDEIRQIY